GRLINHRQPNAVDLQAVFARLAEQGRAVEVNGLPDRLDLRDEHVRQAREAGVAVVVNTDAHSTRGLGNMQLAVATARRGGAAPRCSCGRRRPEEAGRTSPSGGHGGRSTCRASVSTTRGRASRLPTSSNGWTG